MPRVTEVVAGDGMTLCGALDEDAAPIVVQECAGSQSLQPAMYFGYSMMCAGEHVELSGSSYPLSPLQEPAARLGDARAQGRSAVPYDFFVGIAEFVALRAWPDSRNSGNTSRDAELLNPITKFN